jgi:predicted SAM-dependent methyltransferase
MPPVLANLGCGSRYHREWLNFDLSAAAPEVTSCDAFCDAVFNSALLEHLSPYDAGRFLNECQRILKKGGIFRVGVPDLERIARKYLQKLEECITNNGTAHADYEWILFELLDQMCRTEPGGRMSTYLSQPHLNGAFIERQIGEEYRNLLKSFELRHLGRWRRLWALPAEVRRHKILGQIKRAPATMWRTLVSLLLMPADRRALRLGRFRMAGEVHLWMYDRYSLARLLEEHGFQHIRILSAGESAIPAWQQYQLDVDADGHALKPDLLYVECNK